MSKPLIILPSEVCALCGQTFENEELVLVESGDVEPMRKDPSCLVFTPDWKKKDAHKIVNLVVHVHHFQCYYDRMTQLGMGWCDRESDRFCSSCNHDFMPGSPNHNPLISRWAYRYSVGGIGRHLYFEVDIDIPRQSIMCFECTVTVYGEGNKIKGDRRLYDHLNR